MRVERVDYGTVTILRMDGDIDENGIEALRSALYECFRDARFNLVMNLETVRFISYLGLGVLVERLRKARFCKGDIKLVGLNLYAQRLLRMSGVTSLFESYESETQAIAVFQEAA